MKHLKKMLFGSLIALGTLAQQASAATFVGDRTDFRDETIYFAMTTRFYDGDPQNNVYCWDGVKNVKDPEWRGDFQGLINKLDYIKALGFTAVWITPVVENASGLDYHGYHALDFSKVDHRYVTKDATAADADVAFQKLIDEVHKRDMKLVLDIVLQHTGNFGETNLCPMFKKDYTKNLADINASMIPLTVSKGGLLPDNYLSLPAQQQYDGRLALMKNTDFTNKDIHNYYHHKAWFDWDDPSRWWGQIAGDCVDLNTEHPAVTGYLVDCYSRFIKMGVDGFRIDTAGHIPRLSFNKNFLPQLLAASETPEAKEKRGNTPFFMYGEVCARSMEVIYRGENYNCSPCYYTWKESKDYPWDYDPKSWDSVVAIPTPTEGSQDYFTVQGHTNWESALQSGKDDLGHSDAIMRKSNNALLNGNEYHAPDHSDFSGLNVIDFAMHWNFNSAQGAFGVHHQDNLYNDATYNVVYVDSHDYAPDSNYRFTGTQDVWAENLSLMFTFRGIPCLYYGSEVEFQKGKPIDKGAVEALRDTGRAYFGGFIEGNVNVKDFADYSDATGNLASTLTYPLARHIQRLNKIRAAVPALRKGQYSTDGCSGKMSYKRRYVDSKTDSYALVTVSGNSKFTGILNGTYVDAITGDTKTVTNGTLEATCSGKGNLRIYVLNTAKTPAPGKVGEDGKYLYTSAPVDQPWTEWPDNTMPDDTWTVKPEGGGGGDIEEPEEPITPAIEDGEQAVFFENTSSWGGYINVWIWKDDANYTGGKWPGQTLTYLGNKIWKWTYTGTETVPDGALMIFSNGNDQVPGRDQGGFKFVNGGYYTQSGYVKTIEPETSSPRVSISPNGGTFTETLTVTLKPNKAATSASYKIGNGNNVTLSGTASVTIGENMAVGESVTISWTASDGTTTNSGSATFTKMEKPKGITIYADNSEVRWTPLKIHHFDTNGTTWPGVDMLKVAENIFTYTVPNGSRGVVFNNGSGSQTEDLLTLTDNHLYLIKKANGNGKATIEDKGIYNSSIDDYYANDIYAGIEISLVPGGILVTSSVNGTVHISNISGQMRSIPVTPGQTLIEGLEGFYVVNGMKLFVR